MGKYVPRIMGAHAYTPPRSHWDAPADAPTEPAVGVRIMLEGLKSAPVEVQYIGKQRAIALAAELLKAVMQLDLTAEREIEEARRQTAERNRRAMER